MLHYKRDPAADFGAVLKTNHIDQSVLKQNLVAVSLVGYQELAVPRRSATKPGLSLSFTDRF